MKLKAATIVLLAFASTTALGAEPVKLEIVGTGDGMEALNALAADFMSQNADVKVQIPPSIGSGGGIAAVGSSRAILGRVARKLTDTERDAGIVYKPIAKLPSAFFTHPSTNMQRITAAQLVDIYEGRITNWKELGGSDIRIRVVRREDTDSTFIVLRSSMPGWKDIRITARSKMATTTQEAIETVREVQGAIGFGPYSRSLEPGLSVLKVDGRHPTEDDYASSVELALIYTDATITQPARAFVEYASGRRGHDVMAGVGGVPIRE
jgi:phosphate transport system substrate-binding protein